MLAIGGYKVFRYIQDKNTSDRIIEDMTMAAITASETGDPELPDEREAPGSDHENDAESAIVVDAEKAIVAEAKPKTIPAAVPTVTSDVTAVSPTEHPTTAPDAAGTAHPTATFTASAKPTGIDVEPAAESKSLPEPSASPAAATAALTAAPSPTPVIIRPQLDLIEQAPIIVDFEKLADINPDIAGWLFSENVINEPVVWSTDNVFYMNHAPNKSYNVNGTIFMDSCMAKDLSDKNILMYGHNMRNGVRFGRLAKYKRQKYYDEHKVIYFMTPQGDYAIELIAGCVANADSEFYKQAETDVEMAERIARAKSKSTFDSIVDFESGDTIVTMSTCSYEADDARYLIIGRLVPLNSEEQTVQKTNN